MKTTSWVLILFPLVWIVAISFAEAGEVKSPNIFWISQPVAPGDVVSVYGDGLDYLRTIRIQRLTDAPFEKRADDAEVVIRAEQATNESLLFRVPASLAPGTYELKGKDNDTAIALINTPKIYWIQGDSGETARAGGWVRIMGNSIALRDGALARLKSADGRSREFKLINTSRWDSRLDLPRDLAPGSYELDVWNGYGDARAWTSAGKFVVERDSAPPQRVRELTPDQVKRSGDLQRILNEVGAEGGGAVRLRPGIYYFDTTLRVPAGVALQGAGKNLTSLVWTKNGATDDLIVGETNFTLSDFTLFAGEHGHVISGGFSVATGEARDISILNVVVRASAYRGHLSSGQIKDRLDAQLRFSTGGADSIRLSGRNLTIIGCEIYGSGRSLYLLNPHFAYIHNNTFSNGRWGWYSLTGANGVIFENNVIQGGDLMAAGGGANVLDRSSTGSRNIFFGSNTLSALNGWDREAFTSDGFGEEYAGGINDADRDSVLLPPGAHFKSINAPTVGLGVLIVGGKGRGQLAQIARIDGQRIFLDRPWKVVPDQSAVVIIAKTHENYLIIDNKFFDTGVAVQFYGTSINHIVSGNRATRSAGFLSYAMNHRGIRPNWYVQIIENNLDNSINYIDNSGGQIEWGGALLGFWAVHAGPSGVPMVLAPVIRRNVLDSNAKIVVRPAGHLNGSIEGAVVQSNVFLGLEHLEMPAIVNGIALDNRSISSSGQNP